jgi:hypothetical protein
MKKQMKKTILTLLIIFTTTILLFSCKKESVDPTQQSTTSTTTASNSNLRFNRCQAKTDLNQLLMAGTHCRPKKWLIQYYDTLGNRMDIPTLISPTEDNVFYWQPNDSLIEYSYTGQVMDRGTWKLQDCGNVALINTTLSGGDNPFKMEVVRPDYLQGSFYIPAGPQGQLVFVRVKFYLSI